MFQIGTQVHYIGTAPGDTDNGTVLDTRETRGLTGDDTVIGPLTQYLVRWPDDKRWHHPAELEAVDELDASSPRADLTEEFDPR